MNKFELIGSVAYVEVNTYEKENGKTIKKTSWFLNTKKGNQYNNLPCESWNHSFEALVEGMTIELTDYIPTNNRYQDKETGQWKSRFVIDVKEARVVDLEEIGGQGLVVTNAPQSKPTITPTQQFKQNMNNFDVQREIEKLEEEGDIEEELEEVVDLDWDEDHKKQIEKDKEEWEAKQKETINQLEQELDHTPMTVEEIINQSVTTKQYTPPTEEFENKVEEVEKMVVTQEYLNTLNNIPKIQEETTPVEGEVNGIPGAKFIQKDEW